MLLFWSLQDWKAEEDADVQDENVRDERLAQEFARETILGLIAEEINTYVAPNTHPLADSGIYKGGRNASVVAKCRL